ncbi:MAG: hypothetical protein WBN18_12630 [Flavobacteriaceae bacterium]
MKRILFTMLLLLFLVGCDKEQDPTENTLTSVSGKGKSAKVDVCHNGKIINVNGNALPAHRKHGDAVDMDGDGLFDIDNICSATDCDDTNANDCPDEPGTAALLIGTWTTVSLIINTSVGDRSVIDYLIDVVGLTPTEGETQFGLIEAALAAEVTGSLTINADHTYASNFEGGSDSGTWSLTADERILTLFEGPNPDLIIITINAITSDTWNATLGDDILIDVDNDPATPDVLVTAEAIVTLTK